MPGRVEGPAVAFAFAFRPDSLLPVPYSLHSPIRDESSHPHFAHLPGIAEGAGALRPLKGRTRLRPSGPDRNDSRQALLWPCIRAWLQPSQNPNPFFENKARSEAPPKPYRHCGVIPSEAFFSGAEGPAFAFALRPYSPLPVPYPLPLSIRDEYSRPQSPISQESRREQGP